jgi:NADH dehydrogenase
VVINLIGIGLERGKNSYYRVHVEFPTRLASIVKKSNVKLVHISAFIGNAVEAVNTEGSARLKGGNKYIKTKIEGECAVFKNNQKAIIIRPSMLIGDNAPTIKMFEKVIDSLPIVPLVMGGKTKIQPVFAGDVAKFIVNAFEVDEMQGKTFNLLGNEVILLKEFVERICGFMNKRPLLISVPLFLVKFSFKTLELLPKFIFRLEVTSDIISLSKYDAISKKNDIKLLIESPKTIDDVLKTALSKYKLYD